MCGKKLYKYKAILFDEQMNEVLDTIKRKRFLLPNRKLLNDPLEGICDLDFGYAGSQYYAETPFLTPQYETVLNRYRIFSLTEDNDNIVMWTHYGARFVGVCYELDMSRYLERTKKITYSQQIVKAGNREFEVCAEEALYVKSTEWSYEKEWRYISDKNDFIEFDKSEILKISIGYNVPGEKINLIEKACQEDKIKMDIAFVNPYKYRVEFKSLEDYKKLLASIGCTIQ